MKNMTRFPAPISAALVLASCFALIACDRTDAPAGEVSPSAREAASEADAIAVPPVPQTAEPAAAPQPQSPASPTSSTDEAVRPSVADKTAGAATAEPATSAPAGDDKATTAAGGAAASEGKLYQVVDGYKVDAATMEGFRTWRAAACDRCHGANQEGMVGPSLIESLKVRDKAHFVDVLTNGRLTQGMPSFESNTMVMENMDELYAYLKGRSDGAITRAKVEPMS